MRAFNSGEDPEQEPIHFYPAMSDFLWLEQKPVDFARYAFAELPPERRMTVAERVVADGPTRFYETAIHDPGSSDLDRGKAIAELAWHHFLQPEYKVWPAAIAALASTSVEIDCKHMRLPFPAITLRMPTDFMREEGKPAIENVLCTIVRNDGNSSYPTTSMEGSETSGLRLDGVSWSSRGERVPAVLMIAMKFNDPRFSFGHGYMLFTLGLRAGQSLRERLEKLDVEKLLADPRRYQTGYVPSAKLIRDIFSVVIGCAFLATSRLRKDKPIVTPGKNPRPERRRFEKKHGKPQPTFDVGRDLVLPRASGVPTPAETGEQGPGEGAGRQLKHSHYRTGFMRYQPYGPRGGEQHYELIFIEPTMVRPDLPVKPTTPSEIRDVGGTFDVTERGPGS
jgi:hypothetical protein